MNHSQQQIEREAGADAARADRLTEMEHEFSAYCPTIDYKACALPAFWIQAVNLFWLWRSWCGGDADEDFGASLKALYDGVEIGLRAAYGKDARTTIFEIGTQTPFWRTTLDEMADYMLSGKPNLEDLIDTINDAVREEVEGAYEEGY